MFVCEGADEGGADSSRDEAAGVEGGDGFFGEVLFVFVECVDMRALHPVGGDGDAVDRVEVRFEFLDGRV